MPLDSGDEVERAECYNPLCEETLTCEPDENTEGYCSWNCAVMARSGTANRILREGETDARC